MSTVNKVNGAQTDKVTTAVESKIQTSVNVKDSIVGLKVPGSNWQRFKSLVTEATQQTPNNTSNEANVKKRKRKNHRQRNAQQMQKPQEYQKPQQFTEVIRLIFHHFCLLVYHFIIMLCGFKEQTSSKDAIKKEEIAVQNTGLTKVIAMDCEMVGIGDGTDSMLARISIVNRYGHCLYDKYVKPTEEVQDYRTSVSGIRPDHLINGEDFKIVQKEVSDILKGRVLVGHALHNDLSVLFLSHPRRFQRDTSRYKLFRKVTKGNTPSLKKLASELLGVDIQSGEHNSIEDARAAMQLYQLFRKKWECDIKKR